MKTPWQPLRFALMTFFVNAGAFEVFDPIDPQPGIRTPMERLVEEPLPRTVCEGCMVFALSHRPYREAFADPLRDMFGYDGGFLRVRLDLRVGLLPWLDVGTTRTNGILLERYDAWSADFRMARKVELSEDIAFDIGTQAGFTWFEQEDAPDALAPWTWSGIGATMGSVWLGSGFEWHANSSSPDKTDSDADGTIAVHTEAILRIRPNLSLTTEIVRPVAGYGHGIPSWTFGPRWTTWRHVFSIWMGNARTGGPDGRLVGARRWGAPVLGFQIVREATLWNTGKQP